MNHLDIFNLAMGLHGAKMASAAGTQPYITLPAMPKPRAAPGMQSPVGLMKATPRPKFKVPMSDLAGDPVLTGLLGGAPEAPETPVATATVPILKKG